ncbi:MAG: small basic protein [Candidatus Omnitrophica bacterium]|nr:small basic protein [Candidatus Omnitrophota bacterium]
MSIHPSLKIDSAGTQHKTVLSRIQRIKDLMTKGKWQEGSNVTSLPKTKIVKVKARKTKAADKPAEGDAKKAEKATK